MVTIPRRLEPRSDRPRDGVEHLGSGDASLAYTGMWRLAADPQHAVPFLRERLRALPVPDGRMARLIADLDSKRFRVREQASTEPMASPSGRACEVKTNCLRCSI